MHFTSGTTGRPKGAILVHDVGGRPGRDGALRARPARRRRLLVHRRPGLGDRHVVRRHRARWSAASPASSTRLEFDADRWYSIIEQQKGDRLVHRAHRHPHADEGRAPSSPRNYDLGSLRFLASVGEPLNPEAVVWSREAFGRPFHDNWWQTETGGIMIANFAALPIKPGSMGKPLPGIEAAIVERTPTGRAGRSTSPTSTASWRSRPGWPSMFRGYLGEDERYRKCFAGGWYLTGDLARRDRDGYYWFVGRSDDVIKTAGHLVGPFEVESALMEHPAVAEAAVDRQARRGRRQFDQGLRCR